MAIKLWLDNTENDLNQGDDHWFSPLHWAARHGHGQVVELLISRGTLLIFCQKITSQNITDRSPVPGNFFALDFFVLIALDL